MLFPFENQQPIQMLTLHLPVDIHSKEDLQLGETVFFYKEKLQYLKQPTACSIFVPK